MHAVLEQVLRRLGGPVTPESLPRALELLDERARRAGARDRRRPRGGGAGGMGAGRRGRPAALPGLRGARRIHVADPRRRAAVRIRSDDEQRTRCRRSSWARTCACAGSSTGSTPSADGHAIVRDYKSGSARPEHQGARWESDRQLQVALYMIAVRELLGLEPVAGFYQPLGGRRPAGPRRVPEGRRAGRPPGRQRRTRAARSSTRCSTRHARRALALAARLRAGALEPCPATCSRDGCSYPGYLPCLSCRRPTRTERAFTDEQLVAIERREGDLLLDAGAGSGKTSVLVERFVRSVLEDGIEVRRDPHDHVHREGGRRDARSHPRPAARARRRRGGAGHRRRVHLDHPRLLRAPAARPRAGRRSRPGVRRARRARRRAAGRRRLRGRAGGARSHRPSHDRPDRRVHGRRACAARSSRCTTSCAPGASGGRGCPRWVGGDQFRTWTAARRELADAAAAAARELGAIVDPGSAR